MGWVLLSPSHLLAHRRGVMVHAARLVLKQSGLFQPGRAAGAADIAACVPSGPINRVPSGVPPPAPQKLNLCLGALGIILSFSSA